MRTNRNWLSTKEAAEQLGITTMTIYRLIDEGQLPAYKFGRVIRLKETEVTEFERLGHMGPVTHAEVVNPVIAQFLRRCAARR